MDEEGLIGPHDLLCCVAKVMNDIKCEKRGFATFNVFVFLFIAFSYKKFGKNVLRDDVEWTSLGPISKYLSIYHSNEPRELVFDANACELSSIYKEFLDNIVHLMLQKRPENIYFALTRAGSAWDLIGQSRQSKDKVHIYVEEDFLDDLEYLFHNDLPSYFK